MFGTVAAAVTAAAARNSAVRQLRWAAVAARPPRHRPTSRRNRPVPSTPQAVKGGVSAEAVRPTAGDDLSEDVPDWAFEEQPVWLLALQRFLAEPGVLLLDIGDGHPERSSRDEPEWTFEELRVPLVELRSWSRQGSSSVAHASSAADKAEQSRPRRPLAVFGETSDQAALAVEVLRSEGYKEVANVRTRAFLRRILKAPSS
mmetsp:Transcript_60293/g.168416  ORF Transcript_60293/g.168416 Transcript_60293/m.168416 type:complete len:202 (-) Transcript_60293:64-669(-)